MEDLRKRIESFKKKCLVAELTKINAESISAITSNCGGLFFGLPDEEWPSFDSKPLIPLLSIYIDELPFTPLQLRHIKLLNVFAYEEGAPIDEDEGSVVIREYSSTNNLVPLSKPVFSKPSYRIVWREEDDFPNGYQLEQSLTALEYTEYCENEMILMDDFPNHSGIKIGGWPKLIQETHFLKFDEPDFIFQFDSNDVFMFCDSGIGYFMKRNKWFSHWETA